MGDRSYITSMHFSSLLCYPIHLLSWVCLPLARLFPCLDGFAIGQQADLVGTCYGDLVGHSWGSEVFPIRPFHTF